MAETTAARVAVLAILRLVGFVGLFAIPAAFLPAAWMNTIHSWAGLGELPAGPIVIYLARSLSVFYGVFSIMTLLLSTDLDRYRPLIRVWGLLFAAIGGLLLCVDILIGMPTWWVVIEGPPSIAVGVTLLWLMNRIPPPTPFSGHSD